MTPTKKFTPVILLFLLLTAGCTGSLRTSPSYPQLITQTKTIAVMPPDIHVYQLTAGGVREEMDEWNQTAKKLIEEKLKKHLAQRFGFEIKFIDEDWLKKNHKETWTANRSLFDAVSTSALQHGYAGSNAFATKLKNFDYTLGQDTKKLADICESDALLFIYGFDHEATLGRTMMSFWSALAGVYLLNPSLMVMGLVDGKTGDVIWFKISFSESEYSFHNEKSINSLIEWLTRDFLKKK